MRLLVVADLRTVVDPGRDGTLALLAAAQALGHRAEVCLPAALSLGGAGPAVRLRGEPEPVAGFDAVLLRIEPPVDCAFLALTHLLEHACGDALIVNDPRGLREVHEKLHPLRWPDLVPETLVSADAGALRSFAREHAAMVVKPLHGHGGRGVVRLEASDVNLPSLLETMTAAGCRPVIAQRYLPEVREGDKRILLLDGRPLGAFRRVPAAGDFRANLRNGATALPADLDADDRRIIDRVAPALRRNGLGLAGLDVIGGRLTEINVTCPTGFAELADTGGPPAAEEVLTWMEEAAHVPAC